MTAAAYWYAGLFTAQSAALIPWILPSILIGVPIGAALISRVPAETFRRVCMSFDAWIVGFGISTLLQKLNVVPGPSAFLVLAIVVLIDVWLLYVFFSRLRQVRPATI